MAKHHPDLVMCRKQPGTIFYLGISIGALCEKCDGKCVICDSYVRPSTLVKICDECNYGSYKGLKLFLIFNEFQEISIISRKKPKTNFVRKVYYLWRSWDF